MSMINKNEEMKIKVLEAKDLENVAGGNILGDLVDIIVTPINEILKPTKEPVKGPLPFPNDPR